jgi:hypothetical protein
MAEESFVRRKNSLQGEQVSDACVEEAARYARALVHMRTRGPGDRDNAIRAVARECGLPKGSVWGLLYRRPAHVWAHVLKNLHDGYNRAREEQLRLLEHEIAITRLKAGSAHNSVQEAQALVDAAKRVTRGIEP